MFCQRRWPEERPDQANEAIKGVFRLRARVHLMPVPGARARARLGRAQGREEIVDIP